MVSAVLNSFASLVAFPMEPRSYQKQRSQQTQHLVSAEPRHASRDRPSFY